MPLLAGFARAGVLEAPGGTSYAATTQQNQTRDVEKGSVSDPTASEGPLNLRLDTQPIVVTSANVGGNEEGAGLPVSPSQKTSPAKGNVVASAISPFWLFEAEPRLSSFSTGTSGSFIIATPPAKVETHRFFNRANLIGIAVHTAVRSADAAQTCALLSRGAHEAWLPMKSCPAIAAYSLSMVPAQIASSYLMHRKRNYIMEKWMPYMWAAPSAVAIGVSMRAW